MSDGLERTLAALRQAQEEADPMVLVRTPDLIVSLSEPLDPGPLQQVQRALRQPDADVNRWLVGANIHVAVRQPDGSWVRVCHDHPIQAPANRPGQKAVWLTDELFDQLGLIVSWGEPDAAGFYSPTITRLY